MKALPLILIAGWGHTSEAMLRLKTALDGHPMDGYPIQVTSTGELWQTQSGGTLPRMPGLSRYAVGLHNLLASFGGRVDVIGWSMGSIVALETAREYPGLFQQLVIISGTARFSAENDEFPGVSAAVLRAMARGLRRTPDNVLAAYYNQVHAPQGVPVHGNFPPEADPSTADNLCSRDRWSRSSSCGRTKTDIADVGYSKCCSPIRIGEPDSMAKATMRGEAIAKLDCSELLQGLDYLQRMDVRKGLNQIAVPTLVVHGREDRIVPWQAGEWLSGALAVSNWCCYEGLGHALPIQAAARLAADIRSFLA